LAHALGGTYADGRKPRRCVALRAISCAFVRCDLAFIAQNAVIHALVTVAAWDTLETFWFYPWQFQVELRRGAIAIAAIVASGAGERFAADLTFLILVAYTSKAALATSNFCDPTIGRATFPRRAVRTPFNGDGSGCGGGGIFANRALVALRLGRRSLRRTILSRGARSAR
jgi:hypothetical protein